MTAHAYGCAVKNRRQSKKPPSLRLRGLKSQINTFCSYAVHISLENNTQFPTKRQNGTNFRTKAAQKPHPMGRNITIYLYSVKGIPSPKLKAPIFSNYFLPERAFSLPQLAQRPLYSASNEHQSLLWRRSVQL